MLVYVYGLVGRFECMMIYDIVSIGVFVEFASRVEMEGIVLRERIRKSVTKNTSLQSNQNESTNDQDKKTVHNVQKHVPHPGSTID